MSSESLPTVGGLSTWRRYPTPISSRPRWPGLSGSDLQPALYLPRPSHGPSPKRSFCWFLTIVNTSSTRQRRWPKHSYDCVQSGEALTLIDEAIGMVEENGDLLYMAEALRVKGNVLLSLPQHRPDDAEICFTQSLDWSRRQGARSWELRTAIELAALWAAQGQRDRARDILPSIFEQFVEGLDTTDLKAAEHLLATL